MCRIGLGLKEGPLSQQKERGVGDRIFIPDGFWLLDETGVEDTDWRSQGSEAGRWETKVWKSSCVERDRTQTQGSLETCLVMWRGLEPCMVLMPIGRLDIFVSFMEAARKQVGRKQVAK